MAGETVITVVGNLTADPELRYTQGGVPVANFTIAATPRFFDRNSNDWKDGETLFMRCSVWREFAENVAGSLHKGDRVVATGTLKPNTYETAQGEKRTTMQLDVDEIGPSLKRATAQVTRAATELGQGGANSTPGGQYAPTDVQGAPGADSWNASTPTYGDDTPF